MGKKMETITTAKGTKITITENGAAKGTNGLFFWLDDLRVRDDGEHAWAAAAEKKIGARVGAYVIGKAVFLASDPATARIVELAAEHKAAAKAEQEKRSAEQRAKRQAVIDACPAGFVPCSQLSSNSEAWSAIYVPLGGSVRMWLSDTLEQAGCGIWYIPEAEIEKAKADKAVRDAADAVAAAEKAEKVAAEEARKAEIKAAAIATGERKELRRWSTTDCRNGNRNECSCDIAILWAMPDGAEKTTYTCTF